MLNPRQVITALKQNIGKVIVGKDEVIELLLIAMLCKGHVLIEDVPGTGKDNPGQRPGKIAGLLLQPHPVHSRRGAQRRDRLYDGEFQDRRDGIPSRRHHVPDRAGGRDHRTSPKTQSALLEVMEEYQVTVDGVTHPMPKPFMVLATQTRDLVLGTYPLPEAQMDRFFLRVSMGYPTLEEEMAVLERFSGTVKPQASLTPVCSARDVIAMQDMVGTVYCSKEVRHYVANIAAMTRTHPSLQLGVSTRGAIALIRGAQACALLNERDYILPEDVQRMVLPVLAHRVSPSPEAKMKGISAERILIAVVENVPVPLRLS